jgi:hypothetical protein
MFYHLLMGKLLGTEGVLGIGAVVFLILLVEGVRLCGVYVTDLTRGLGSSVLVTLERLEILLGSSVVVTVERLEILLGSALLTTIGSFDRRDEDCLPPERIAGPAEGNSSALLFDAIAGPATGSASWASNL